MTSPKYKLYSSKQIAVAAWLGSPLAGGWFMSHNHRQLGQQANAISSLIWGILGTVLVLLIAFAPESSSLGGSGVLAFLAPFIFWQTAEKAHGKAVAQHITEGGQFGSWWVLIGISLLFLILAIGAAYIVRFMFLTFIDSL